MSIDTSKTAGSSKEGHSELPKWHNSTKPAVPKTRKHCIWLTAFLIALTLLAIVLVTAVWLPIYRSRRHDGRPAPPPLEFVRLQGSKFEADCGPFRIVGFNAHDLVEVAMIDDINLEANEWLVPAGRQQVSYAFNTASNSGLNVIRTWTHTSLQDFPFQIQPGVYNPKGLEALDYIVEQARLSGLRIVFSFIDNWKYYNGVDQYVDWSPSVPPRTTPRSMDENGDPVPTFFTADTESNKYEAARHSLFFVNEDVKAFYRNHVQTIVNRRNSINGQVYRDDPTIMAWNLINEPRCETWAVPECGDHLQGWIEEMSAFVRQQDPNHLISIGSEGFFKESSPLARYHPQPWAGTLGQDFVRNTLARHIDFATIHVWPDNWNSTSATFLQDWVTVHAYEAQQKIQKPIVLEEFGKKLPIDQGYKYFQSSIAPMRDPVYQLTYDTIQNLMTLNTPPPIMGSMFWRWHFSTFKGNWTDDYGVQPTSSTMAIVESHAVFIHEQMRANSSSSACADPCWFGIGGENVNTRVCSSVPSICQAYKSRSVSPKISSLYGNFDHRQNISSTSNATAGFISTTYFQRLRAADSQKDTAMLLAGEMQQGTLLVYASQKACCEPGTGAFDDGCTDYWPVGSISSNGTLNTNGTFSTEGSSGD